MTLIIILSILFIHWVADFVLQTDKQAKGKSKNWSDLLAHTFTYSTMWIFASCLLIGYESKGHTTQWYVIHSILFGLVTFICHTITDYFTSRLNSKLWAKGDVHNFFVSIGFDQYLHYIQLFVTFYLLSK
jgi:Protein of unknown function (DUF3307)